MRDGRGVTNTNTSTPYTPHMHTRTHAHTHTHTTPPTHPSGLVPDEADGLQCGTPPLELGHPVGEGGLGRQYQVGMLHVAHVHHVA